MSTLDIIFTVLGTFAILKGLVSLITGRVFTICPFTFRKYTEESIKKYARPNGFMSLILGCGTLAFILLRSEPFHMGAVIKISCCAVAIVISIMNRNVLEKK